MIEPLKAIAGRTTMTKPSVANPFGAYKNTMNCSTKGEKLNIDCNEVRSLTRDGLKLDYYA